MTLPKSVRPDGQESRLRQVSLFVLALFVLHPDSGHKTLVRWMAYLCWAQTADLALVHMQPRCDLSASFKAVLVASSRSGAACPG